MRRGCAYLRTKQRPDGSWEKEHVAGITNRNCAIDYVAYWSIFPVWALAAEPQSGELAETKPHTHGGAAALPAPEQGLRLVSPSPAAHVGKAEPRA